MEQGVTKTEQGTTSVEELGVQFPSEFVTPGQSGDGQETTEDEHQSHEGLSSPDIMEDLTGTELTGLSVNKTDTYEPGSYIIDLSKCEEGATRESSEALKLLMDASEDDADGVAIYVSTGKMVFRIGKSKQYTVYRLLNRLVKPLFGEGVELLHHTTEGFKRVKSIQISEARLNL